MQKWQVEEAKIIYDASPYFRLRQERCILPNGLVIPNYNIIEEADIVMVFALTPSQDVILVEQYKHGIGEVCLALPGGLCESDEPLIDIKRELQEETAYQSDHWQQIGSYIKDPTRNPNRIHVFLAKGCYPAGETDFDPTEFITVHTMPLAEIETAIMDGRINTIHTIAAIHTAMKQLA